MRKNKNIGPMAWDAILNYTYTVKYKLSLALDTSWEWENQQNMSAMEPIKITVNFINCFMSPSLPNICNFYYFIINVN